MSKFETKYKSEYARMLDEYLSDDSDPHYRNSFTSFAKVIGVNESTLWAWLRTHPEFRAVKEKYAKRKTS